MTSLRRSRIASVVVTAAVVVGTFAVIAPNAFAQVPPWGPLGPTPSATPTPTVTPTATPTPTPTPTVTPTPTPTPSPTTKPGPKPVPAPGKRLWGTDISGYQHPYGKNIAFASMKKAGALFTFIKITEGTSFINNYAAADRLAARKVGMYTGFYHFALVRPGNMASQATAQAKYAVGALAGRAGGYATGDLPLVLDLEPIGVSGSISNAQLTTWAKTWLTYVQKRTGRAPLIYGSPSFLARLTRGVGLEKFPLWVAHYTYPAKNPLPGAVGGPFRTPWTTTSGKIAWAFWQYTSSGPGVAMGVAGGSVDQDVWNGLATSLTAFTKGSWTPQPVDYLPADLRTSTQIAGPTTPVFGTPTTYRASVRNANATPVGALNFYVTAPGTPTVVVPGVPAAPVKGAPANFTATLTVPVPGTIVKATFTSNVFGSSTKSVLVDVPLAAPVAIVQPGQATLAWPTPAITDGLTDYAIEYSADGGKTWTTWPHPNPSTNGTQTLALSGGTYVFRVTPIYGTVTGTRSLISTPYVVPPIPSPTPTPTPSPSPTP